MEFDLENPFTSLQEQQSETISDLFATESDHMPLKASDFLVCFHQEALSLILQAEHSCNLDPFITYLAVNYMDRFISRKEIPQGKPWILRLVVISSLSLAAKMKNTRFPLSNFQREEGFIFDTQTINRMELLILDALDWRMRSITPFSFIGFFVSFFELKDPSLIKALKDRATEIIFKALGEVGFLEFKPSINAASALLLASYELFPLQFLSFKTSIYSSECVNKEMLLKCFNAMQEMVEMEGYESMLETVSSTRTPVSVLARHCAKSESDSTTSTSAAAVMAEKRDIKRRRMNGYYRNNRVQLSQVQRC